MSLGVRRLRPAHAQRSATACSSHAALGRACAADPLPRVRWWEVCHRDDQRSLATRRRRSRAHRVLSGRIAPRRGDGGHDLRRLRRSRRWVDLCRGARGRESREAAWSPAAPMTIRGPARRETQTVTRFDRNCFATWRSAAMSSRRSCRWGRSRRSPTHLLARSGYRTSLRRR